MRHTGKMTYRVTFRCGARVQVTGETDEEARAKIDKRLGKWKSHEEYEIFKFVRIRMK